MCVCVCVCVCILVLVLSRVAVVFFRSMDVFVKEWLVLGGATLLDVTFNRLHWM